jgi:hypothetical protein
VGLRAATTPIPGTSSLVPRAGKAPRPPNGVCHSCG